MRSVILVLATIGVLSGAFLLYALLQTAPPALENARQNAVRLSDRRADGGATTQSVDKPSVENNVNESSQAPAAPAPVLQKNSDPNERIIGAGENVWVKSFDKNNRLANEFRAAKYDPQGDLVNVTRPQARFYLDDGAVLLIDAAHGQVVIPAGTGQRETMRDSRGQAPTRGELYDVTLSLLKTVDATDPILRCTMNNIVFDNDTFRIATEAFTDASGQTIPAERVPVTIRGQDYDFDGYGLVIRWNEVDQRLQLLEVARGDRLVVKNPGALKLDSITLGRGDAAAAGNTVTPAVPIEVKWAGPLRVTPGKISKTLDRQHYRAMLTEQVKVTQAENELATADVLELAFSVEPQDKPAAGRERPVVVSLTGAPTVVKMQGMQARAAVVSFDTATGKATLRSSAEFPQIGLQDSSGRTMFARQVDYDPAQGTATLAGPAKFEIRLPPDAADKNDVRTLVADASKQCVIVFDPSQKEPVIKSAMLSGDVAIDHPQLKLSCQALDLSFAEDAPNGAPALDRLSADGAVSANILGRDGKAQKIQCQSLQLKTRLGAGDQLSAESIVATGDVRIESPQQLVRAGRLEVTFAPNTGSAEKSILSIGDDRVATLLADGNVSFVSPDGGGVWADRVTLNGDPAAPRDLLRVEGKPARIGDARGMLLANLIDFDPATGDAKAVGGGKFQTAFAAAADQPTRPAMVEWTGDLTFDSARGTAQVNDGVTIASDQPDGTKVTGSANALSLAFEKTPATQPAATPLAGRRIRDVNLLGDVQFAAQQNDAAGALRQRMHLLCEKLVYQPMDGQIIVPVAGRMLVEDRRAVETNVGEAKAGSEMMQSPKGATAFQWNEKLSFSPADNRAEMAGDVLVVHQSSDASTRPMRLNADVVLAELAGKAAAVGDTQVKRLSARGNVRFTSGKLEFSAAETEFRPLENIVIARGDDRVPALLLDDQGLSKGTFAELWLNTRTQESHVRDFRAVVRR